MKLGLRLGEKNRFAQTSIELTLAILCVLILLIGISRLFVWLNQSLVERQEAYENIRQTGKLYAAPKYIVSAINSDEKGMPLVKFYTPGTFYIFSQEEPKK